MSKHWNPDEDLARTRGARVTLPHGAGPALFLLAAACIAAGAGLYELIGPKDVFARGHAVDWTAVEAVQLAKRPL